ncbi:hypothetical protein C1I98_26570 [Spongiactinospora gelatinilytica]|uniref:Type I restriction modification DNA specificity domain-containing protein n=1 Tax=Spongiactinospora gelatinilytica TaxID=2666298 RepID=A0A2W2FMC6_9ACTN|nr:restriction endonuclease subunit S [Spongiactinospora gelatinilytica]PZG36672.1 hypothetical protein C1I98_26570 [Spongiactinospora gelatinilytica]
MGKLMSIETRMLGELITPAPVVRAGSTSYPILSMTMHHGLVAQEEKFKKRVASRDTSPYKVAKQGQLVVGFPIDEAVLSFQNIAPAGIVSPAYEIWDLKNPQIERKYLERYLRSPSAITYYKSKLRSTTARRRSIPRGDFLKLPVPFPHITVQRRIVQILDQVDELRAKRRRAIALLDEFHESIFIDLLGDPASNPKGWQVVSMGEIAIIQGGLQVSSKRKSLPIEVPYLRVANAYRNHLDLSIIKTMRVTERELERAALAAGDLLIVEGHGNAEEIGRAALWDGSISPCVHQNHLIRARLGPQAIPAYVLSLLNSAGGRLHLQRSASTTSGLNTISTSDVRAAPIMLPPLESQAEYVERVVQVDQARASMRSDLNVLDELFSSLEAKAFRGEL